MGRFSCGIFLLPFVFIYGIIRSVYGIGRAFVNRPRLCPGARHPLPSPVRAEAGIIGAPLPLRRRFIARGKGAEKLKEHLRFRGDGRAAPDAIREER